MNITTREDLNAAIGRVGTVRIDSKPPWPRKFRVVSGDLAREVGSDIEPMTAPARLNVESVDRRIQYLVRHDFPIDDQELARRGWKRSDQGEVLEPYATDDPAERATIPARCFTPE